MNADQVCDLLADPYRAESEYSGWIPGFAAIPRKPDAIHHMLIFESSIFPYFPFISLPSLPLHSLHRSTPVSVRPSPKPSPSPARKPSSWSSPTQSTRRFPSLRRYSRRRELLTPRGGFNFRLYLMLLLLRLVRISREIPVRECRAAAIQPAHSVFLVSQVVRCHHSRRSPSFHLRLLCCR